MKTIILRYFDVDYVGLTTSSSLVQRLAAKLSSTAALRLMPLNRNESDKSDLISDFMTAKNGLFLAGTSLRVINSREVPIITEEMLNKNQFTVNSINLTANDNEKTCLDYFYFCLSDTKLIVTLDSRSSINRFETYVNWLLNTNDSGEKISFTPTVDDSIISAADLKKITINNTYNVHLSESEETEPGFASKLVSLKNEVLKKIFSETESLKELMNENICSADLVIKFSKPKGMTEDEYNRKTIGTVLKPLEDADSIKFQTKGKKMKGSTILKTETITVDDDNGSVSEQDVYQQMIRRM